MIWPCALIVLIPRMTPINPNKQSTLCFIYSSFCGSATTGCLAAIPIGRQPWQKQCLCQTTTGISHATPVDGHAQRVEHCRLAATPSEFRHEEAANHLV